MSIPTLAPSAIRKHACLPRFGEERKRAYRRVSQAVIAAAACAVTAGVFAKDPRGIPNVPTALQRGHGMPHLRGPGISTAVLPATRNAIPAVTQTTLNPSPVLVRPNAQPVAPARADTSPGASPAGPKGSAPRSDSLPNSAGVASGDSHSMPASNRHDNVLSHNSRGETVLAAGRSVELVDPAEPHLRVEVTAPETSALNLSQIMSDTARSGIFAGLVARREVPGARTAVMTADRRIWLKSKHDGVGFDGKGPPRGGYDGKRLSHRPQESRADQDQAAPKANAKESSAALAAAADQAQAAPKANAKESSAAPTAADQAKAAPKATAEDSSAAPKAKKEERKAAPAAAKRNGNAEVCS